MDRHKAAIIIPAFNEENTIPEVIKKIKELGFVIVVDDNSSDNTFRFAKEAGALVIRHNQNLGYDEALNTGFRTADKLGCQYAITFDADGQHSEEMIKHFLFFLDEGYQLVLGVRPKFSRISEYIYAFFTQYLWQVKDPLCGMKGYDMRLFRHFGGFDNSRSIGTELALKSVRSGHRFKQIDVPVYERQYGRPRFGKIIKANFKILLAMLRVVILNK